MYIYICTSPWIFQGPVKESNYAISSNSSVYAARDRTSLFEQHCFVRLVKKKNPFIFFLEFHSTLLYTFLSSITRNLFIFSFLLINGSLNLLSRPKSLPKNRTFCLSLPLALFLSPSLFLSFFFATGFYIHAVINPLFSCLKCYVFSLSW